jgi:hypothetical protein
LILQPSKWMPKQGSVIDLLEDLSDLL